jgi:hypothetical protein
LRLLCKERKFFPYNGFNGHVLLIVPIARANLHSQVDLSEALIVAEVQNRPSLFQGENKSEDGPAAFAGAT